MKKLILILLLALPFAVMAQIGLGTNNPETSAQLDVSASNKGFLPPRVALTSVNDLTTINSPAKGLMVYCDGTAGLAAGYYFFNGNQWASFGLERVPVANIGDIKYDVQTADHSGWIKLDGRALNTLNTRQQTSAAGLGLSASLPNANEAYLSQNGQTLGQLSSQNSFNLSQSQLPKVTYSGTTASTLLTDLLYNITFNSNSREEGNGSGVPRVKENSSFLANSNSHSHSISVPLNSASTQQSIDRRPMTMSANVFIYLGM